MTIKGRIRVFQAIVALAVTAMAVTALLDLRTVNLYLARVQEARQQLAATSELAISANRYSEQIAELLLIGEPEQPDFDSARAQVIQALSVLREIVLEQAGAAGPLRTRGQGGGDLARLDRMQALFREIDLAVERLLVIDREGRPAEAVTLFRAEIENRLDAEFERLIAGAQINQREEVRALEAEVARFTRWLTIATLAALASLLGVTLVAGFLFSRSIQRPIGALTSGALAIEGGDFEYRIGYRGGDEFGLLSGRFDAMAEQLGNQHAMLVGAQGQLERQVAERTGQLAEANRRLTAADKHRVRFLADISHELRTPLTALRGEAEVALRGSMKPEEVYREALSTVVARAAEMARLVEDLLFLARSEADEIRFDIRRFDLVELVTEAVRDAGVLARQRRVRVNLAPSVVAAGPLTIRGDMRRLKQALLIPLDNALKYSDAGTQAEISVHALSAEGIAEITIRDEGAGIAPQDVPHAFDRFYRGGEARARWAGGNGLGLSIARWIVEKHGGTIQLSSVLGEGTEVRLRLPM